MHFDLKVVCVFTSFFSMKWKMLSAPNPIIILGGFVQYFPFNLIAMLLTFFCCFYFMFALLTLCGLYVFHFILNGSVHNTLSLHSVCVRLGILRNKNSENEIPQNKHTKLNVACSDVEEMKTVMGPNRDTGCKMSECVAKNEPNRSIHSCICRTKSRKESSTSSILCVFSDDFQSIDKPNVQIITTLTAPLNMKSTCLHNKLS